MRSILLKSSLLATGFLFAVSLTAQKAVQPNFASISAKVVNQSLQVKPGETVLITGTPAEIPLMEALYVAVSKAGGKPVVQLGLPEASKKALMETPVAYLKMPNTFELFQARAVDCIINTGSTQNPQLMADVPEEKLAASRSGFYVLQDAMNLPRFRMVSIGQTGGIPTETFAKFKNASYDDMMNMFWKSVDVDYDKLRTEGESIRTTFKDNAEVKVTTPEGTNLTFRLSKLAPRINSGLSHGNNPTFSGMTAAWLPAGEVYAPVEASSANGTLVAPEIDIRGQVIKNLRLKFTNGRITDVQADNNVNFVKTLLSSAKGDADMLSLFDIGINRNSQPLQNSSYYSWEMGGMVTLSTGDNAWAGGTTKSDVGLSFHIPGATVTINGKPVVEKGKLLEKY
jgi:aminopeptidase